jgi:Gram-negative bacterial TonB protein C-terminal
MASATSYRILIVSAFISCLTHVAVLRIPLQGREIARPVKFQFGKVVWRGAVAGKATSRHPWTLAALPAPVLAPEANVPVSDVPVASDKAATAPAPALLNPFDSQDSAWLPLERRFYAAGQLSKRPKVIAEVDLETADTRSLLATGRMVFNLAIDQNGKVLAVDVEQSDLPEVFTQAASNAFMQFKFQPGEIDGTPVGSILRIEITYDDAQLPSGEKPDRR